MRIAIILSLFALAACGSPAMVGSPSPGVSVTDYKSGDFSGLGFYGQLEGFSLLKGSAAENPTDSSGYVKLQFCVNQFGKVVTCTVDSSGTQAAAALMSSAEATSKQFRFTPNGGSASEKLLNCGWMVLEFY